MQAAPHNEEHKENSLNVHSLSVNPRKAVVYRVYSSAAPLPSTVGSSDNQPSGTSARYRLQHSAYINRRDIPPLGHGSLGFNYYPGLLRHLTTDPHDATHAPSAHGSVLFNDGIDNALYHRIRNDKSSMRLPSIVINGSDDLALPHSKSQHRLIAQDGNVVERSTPAPSSLGVPPHHQPTLVSKTRSQKGLPASTHSINTKRRKKNFYDEPSELALKLSLPCHTGCCYCVYARLLGPVKVFVSRADPPKKGPFLGKIKDGNGRPVIPVARKSDLRGLVYDPKSHSLYPPVSKGERPLFHETRAAAKSNKQPPGPAKFQAKKLSDLLLLGPIGNSSCWRPRGNSSCRRPRGHNPVGNPRSQFLLGTLEFTVPFVEAQEATVPTVGRRGIKNERNLMAVTRHIYCCVEYSDCVAIIQMIVHINKMFTCAH
ncbi:hypothetical protein Btru_077449 [Bulinus truncatus]|nr:hypothetical protein Btru_077449 [Bulinus truncatus]